ncbi:hypothetical protein COCNU_02G008620 [Cocos nucifera]|uniref:AB hydrolase-1 domain-containing protein n=1 Tax=Cocos nucifera TaxID=13894 RepID=A0A8K0HZ88_COCNU|nr:hypothetical protein COCNU_02G008620 [Cocos nucifera]
MKREKGWEGRRGKGQWWSVEVAKASGPLWSSGQSKPAGSEPLPKGIISQTSNFEMQPLWGSPKGKGNTKSSKSLLAIPVGIRQKEVVNQIVTKFPPNDFMVMLFHYDGVVDEWRDLQWSDSALHISAINQTKWWFAKRFLHPNIVAEYNYIFLWDEDLDVENFHPLRKLFIVSTEEFTSSLVVGDVMRTVLLLHAQGCSMVRIAFWLIPSWTSYSYLIPYGDPFILPDVAQRLTLEQPDYNDLIHAWGLDKKLGYCAQGDRSKNVGVVDSEYIVHKGIATLGGVDEKKVRPRSPTFNDRFAIKAHPVCGGKGKAKDPIFGLTMGAGSQSSADVFRWFCIEKGSSANPLVILIHGFPSQAYSYRKVLPVLSEDYHAIAFDWLGFGFSDKPQPKYGFDYTLDDFASSLESLVNEMAPDRLSLVVQGYFAPVVVKYASCHQEKLRDLVLINPPDPLRASDKALTSCGPYMMKEEDAMVYRRPYLTSGSSGFALNAISRAMKKELKVTSFSDADCLLSACRS